MAAELNLSVKMDGASVVSRSLDDVRQAIKDLTAEARTVDLGSARFEQIKGAIRDAKTEMRQFALETKADSADAKGSLVGLGNDTTTSLNFAKDSMEAFGSESSAMAAIAGKANTFMALSVGLREVGETKLGASTLKRVAIEKAAAAGTKVMTAINWAFNASLAANPIGVIVIAVAAFVAALVGLGVWLAKTTKVFTVMGDAISWVGDKLRDFGSFITGGLIDDTATAKTKDNAEAVIKALEDVNDAANVNIDNMKRQLKYNQARGDTEAELFEQRKKIAAAEIALEEKKLEAMVAAAGGVEKLEGEKLTNYKNTLTKLANLRTDAMVDEVSYQRKVREEAQKTADDNAKKAKEAHDKAVEAANKKQKQFEEDKTKLAELKKKSDTKEIEDIEAFGKALNNTEDKQAADKIALDKKNRLEELNNRIALAEQNALNDPDSLEYKRALIEAKLQLDLEGYEAGSVQRQNAILEAHQADLDLQQQFADEAEQKRLEAEDIKTSLMDEGLAKQYAQYDAQANAEKAAVNKSVMTAQEKADAIKKIDEKAAKDKKAMQVAQYANELQMAASALDGLASLFSENTAAYKALKVASTIISTLTGAVSAFTGMTESIPGPVGIVLGALAAAGTLAMGYSNVKKILAVKTDGKAQSGSAEAAPPPTPSSYARGGILSGPSHAQGGIATPYGELEGGEAVINKRSTRMHAGLLSAINQSGGGRKFADGGIAGADSKIQDFSTKLDEVTKNIPVTKTYVVSSEMTSSQEAQHKVSRMARL